MTPGAPVGGAGADVASFIAVLVLLRCLILLWVGFFCKCQLYCAAAGAQQLFFFCPDGGSSTRHVSGARGRREEMIQTTSRGFPCVFTCSHPRCCDGLLIAAARAEFVYSCFSRQSSLHLVRSPESSASSAVGHLIVFLMHPLLLWRFLMKVSSWGPQTPADPLTAGAARPVRGTFNCFLGSLTGGEA